MALPIHYTNPFYMTKQPLNPGTWYVVTKGLPGPKANQKIKGMVSYLVSNYSRPYVISFTPRGRFFRSDFLPKGTALEPIPAPRWAKYLVKMDPPGWDLGELYDARNGRIYDHNHCETIDQAIDDHRRAYLYLKKLRQKSRP